MDLVRDPNYDFVRDPDEWETGDEPITDAQREYLSALAAKAGEPISEDDLIEEKLLPLPTAIPPATHKTNHAAQVEGDSISLAR
jgi:hypothetical protein